MQLECVLGANSESTMIHKPEPWLDDQIYLDYATTSYPKSFVALDSFLRAISSPPAARHHVKNTRLQEFRDRIGKVLTVSSRHIFFTSGATIGLNQVIQGFAEDGFRIAFDNRSHNAVSRTCFSLKRRCECILAKIYDAEDNFLEVELAEILSRSPNLLCLTHVSNVTGSIYPVEEIVDTVRRLSPSTSVLIDASQSAGALSLARLYKADFIVFPSHKHLHSVAGAAVVVAKKPLRAVIFGGTGANSAASEMLDEDSLFVEVGTMNLPAIQAMVDSLEYAEAEFSRHRQLETDLTTQFIEGVEAIEGLTLIGRRGIDRRIGIVGIKPEFGSPEFQWMPFLKSQNIHIRGGLHCSPLHHQQLDLLETGTLRFSFGWNSTHEQIEIALQALAEFSGVAGALR
ncbi:MAG: aminotransferase class V-fold PLP-dependent enzyme [Chlamydiia bacterium]